MSCQSCSQSSLHRPWSSWSATTSLAEATQERSSPSAAREMSASDTHRQEEASTHIYTYTHIYICIDIMIYKHIRHMLMLYICRICTKPLQRDRRSFGVSAAAIAPWPNSSALPPRAPHSLVAQRPVPRASAAWRNMLKDIQSSSFVYILF